MSTKHVSLLFFFKLIAAQDQLVGQPHRKGAEEMDKSYF